MSACQSKNKVAAGFSLRRNHVTQGFSPAVLSLRKLYRAKKKDIAVRLDEFKQAGKKGSEEDIFAELCFCLLTPQSKALNCWDAVCAARKKDLLRNGCASSIAEILHRKVRFHNHKASYIVAARKLFSENGKLKIREKLQKITDYHESTKVPRKHETQGFSKTRLRLKNWRMRQYLRCKSLRREPDIKPKGLSYRKKALRASVPPWLIIRAWLVGNVKGMGYKEASHFLRNIGFGKDIAILDRHILKNLKALGVISDIPDTLTEKIYLEIEGKMRDFAERTDIPLESLDLLFWSMQTGHIFK
ncbi:DNA lyase [Candidatus Desantisbacteria bacterium CG_4_10_14_0_8_um_filter_48_22]|uniref:8-oxoguanine DNA glycosylase/AP lyase n=1 Tax=Candidatus Desantisbacteria bacterium CG_4_10_14_0_8_um_filter_48_22 TaxID=1974543 RepID=A0A2M7SFN5_9BACT|nr:MAG: DNA lyase [Candidatus Desantisbacteria bacterium CG02_land_8_20_14_3_00_49_13]PIZ18294.1 MAG: DNA lyase [Candidatus Desantisbacteria bacterium CG_4_10_14_0_8_um_filter_48_22]PJB28139.1 MAG: DNA lyase [Candidatus Desantisbacteria bacterium CG_4_9_14_3_um_filter_50_7]